MVSPCGLKNKIDDFSRIDRKSEEELCEALVKQAKIEGPSTESIFKDLWALPIELRRHILSNIEDYKQIISLSYVSQAWLKIFPQVQEAISSLRISYLKLKPGMLEKISSHFQNCSKLIIRDHNRYYYHLCCKRIIMEVNSFKNLKSLDCCCLRIGINAFKELSLTSIQSLSLDDCGLMDCHFDKLRELTNLEDLNISTNFKLTGVALAAIPTSLKQLDFRNNCLNDNDVIQLARLTNLKVLTLSLSHNFSKAPLEALPGSLTALNCHNCFFSNCQALERLTNLTKLDINSNKKFTGSIVFPDSLKMLNISSCRFTNDNLKEFGRLTQLESLNIRDNPDLTIEVLSYLPNCLSSEGLIQNLEDHLLL